MHGGLPCSMDGSKNVELRTCNVNMCPGMYEISIEKVPSVLNILINNILFIKYINEMQRCVLTWMTAVTILSGPHAKLMVSEIWIGNPTNVKIV